MGFPAPEAKNQFLGALYAKSLDELHLVPTSGEAMAS
jgi:hypothetical protein